ncbi:MAG: hypothetical protein AMXMBFR34_22300 [Myxococcaceae bacterium]
MLAHPKRRAGSASSTELLPDWLKEPPELLRVALERGEALGSGPRGSLRVDFMADELPDWEKLLAAERHLQALLPGTILVGGTAAALLESAAGWESTRVQRPVMILGSLDGIQTGIRQLRRAKPLECVVIEGLRVPTLAEMAGLAVSTRPAR